MAQTKTADRELRSNSLFDVHDDWASGALFSECRTWRYALWRRWDFGSRCNMVAFVGLNPSTADESIDDPTIRRCKGFAKEWGFDGMYMLNAYAFRATDPKDMKVASDATGPDNDHWLRHYGTEATAIVRDFDAKLCSPAWCHNARANTDDVRA